MKPAIFALFLFLATTGSAYPNSYEPQTKGLPPPEITPLTKGLPPPESKGLPPVTKGLPPSETPPPESKGLPPQTTGLPPPETTPLTKGLPPPPPQGGVTPDALLASLPSTLTKAISSGCLSTLFSIVTDPEFLKCIPLAAITSLLPIITDPSLIKKFLSDPAKVYPSIQKPLIAFSDIFCPAPKCDDKKVDQAIKAIKSGCKAELAAKDPLISMAFGVAELYSPGHDSICFKDKKGTYCWDETLTTVVALPKSPIKIVDGGLIDSVAVADPPKVCTACNRAIVNTFGNYLKDKPDAQAALKGIGLDPNVAFVGVAVKCGMSFEDGNVGDPGK